MCLPEVQCLNRSSSHSQLWNPTQSLIAEDKKAEPRLVNQTGGGLMGDRNNPVLEKTVYVRRENTWTVTWNDFKSIPTNRLSAQNYLSRGEGRAAGPSPRGRGRSRSRGRAGAGAGAAAGAGAGAGAAAGAGAGGGPSSDPNCPIESDPRGSPQTRPPSGQTLRSVPSPQPQVRPSPRLPALSPQASPSPQGRALSPQAGPWRRRPPAAGKGRREAGAGQAGTRVLRMLVRQAAASG